MPSVDTVLNLLAVILAAASVALAGTAVYYIRASQSAIRELPQNIAPVRKELSSLRSEAETVAELLRATGDWMQRYDGALKDNAGLKLQVGKLIAQNDSLNGQIVQLNDLTSRLHSVYSSQSAQNERQARTINEQVALIEQLTQALDARKIAELYQALNLAIAEIRQLTETRGDE